MKKIKLFVFLCLLASCSDNEFKGHEQSFSVYGQQYDIGEVVLWHSNNSMIPVGWINTPFSVIRTIWMRV